MPRGSFEILPKRILEVGAEFWGLATEQSCFSEPARSEVAARGFTGAKRATQECGNAIETEFGKLAKSFGTWQSAETATANVAHLRWSRAPPSLGQG